MARQTPESNGRRPSGWLRAARIFVLASIAVLLVFGFQLARLYTDSQWFAELGRSDVFATILGAKLQLFFGFGLLFFLVVWFNLWLARRLSSDVPRSRPLRMNPIDVERERVTALLRGLENRM
jgi:uncharacterized membrane protein (UPF0182 family)